jgi:CheY-like chemotaxis protein
VLCVPQAGVSELPSVLVVDDDTALLRAVQRILEREGCRVVACRRAEEALEHLDKECFDVLLTDVQMPGLGGARLLRAVRERELDIPVVLMTGTPGLESAVAAIEHRALLYLIKPVTAERLADAVARARQSKRSAPPSHRKRYSSHPIVTAVGANLYAYELRPTVAVLEERAGNDAARIAQIIERSRSDLWLVPLDSARLSDEELFEANAPLSRHAERIVLQLSNGVSLAAAKDAHERIRRLRGLGFRIGLDDLGAGYASLQHLAEIEPDWVKLDPSLVSKITPNSAKAKIVSSLVRLCRDLGARLVADGVSTFEERVTLVGLGCDLLQGPLIAAPVDAG